MDRIQFGTFLTEIRKERNLSQQDLADLLYISPQAVSKWERAESLPDIESLQKLSVLYNISIDNLLQCKKEEKKVFISQEENAENKYFKGVNNPKLLTAIFGTAAMIFFLLYFAIPVEYGFNFYSFIFSSTYDVGNYFLLLSFLSKLAILVLSGLLFLTFTKRTTKNLILSRHILISAACAFDFIVFAMLYSRVVVIIYVILSIAFTVLNFVLPFNRFKKTLSEFN